MEPCNSHLKWKNSLNDGSFQRDRSLWYKKINETGSAWLLFVAAGDLWINMLCVCYVNRNLHLTAHWHASQFSLCTPAPPVRGGCKTCKSHIYTECNLLIYLHRVPPHDDEGRPQKSRKDTRPTSSIRKLWNHSTHNWLNDIMRVFIWFSGKWKITRNLG